MNKTVTALVLAISIGAHWPMLQSIAWLNMLVTFSAQDGLPQAVVKTFDGKHGCNLCKFVAAGKQAEKKKSPTQQNVKKFDLMLFAPEVISVECEQLLEHPAFHSHYALRVYPPLSPPPDFV